MSQAEQDELAFLRSWKGLTTVTYPAVLQAQLDKLKSTVKAKAAQEPITQIQNVVDTLQRGGE